MSKKKLIPELRFPEFEDDGEWEDDELGNHCEITTGKLDANAMVENGEYRFYTCAKDYYFIDNFAFDTDALLISGNGAHVGYIHHYNGKFNAYQRTYVLDNFDKDIHYIQYFLERNLKTRIASEKKDGNTPYIVRSTLSEMQILLPKNEEEQQKIASCLSSLDELIAAHTEKLDALQEHKKGLMQNLFPQEGQTVPNYRFSEFEDDGEWVGTHLGNKDVSTFVHNKIDSSELKLTNYISTDNMLPDYSGVSKASKLPNIGRVTEFDIGDILISNIRPYLKKVWKADRKGGASNDVIVFRAGTKITCDFLEAVIKNDVFINYVMKSVKGVKMPRGDKDSMLKYHIRIPKRSEQQKITSCLLAIDELITAQSQKIDELKEHKKGLMQGLFPTIES